MLYYYISKENKAFSKTSCEGEEIKMGTIVCQSCLNTIDHYEDEKVSVLFSNCCDCNDDVELDD